MRHVQSSASLQITGLFLLFFGLTLLGMALYMLPFTYFGKIYEIPEVIHLLELNIEIWFKISPANTLKVIFWGFFFIGTTSLGFARFILMLIEKRQLNAENTAEKQTEALQEEQETKSTINIEALAAANFSERTFLGTLFRILFFILIAVLLIMCLEWYVGAI